MGVHIIETALDRVCEFLDELRMFFEIALFCAVGGVGNVAGVFSEGGDDIAVSLLLQSGREWLKLDRVI